jgi:hypothetical protein
MPEIIYVKKKTGWFLTHSPRLTDPVVCGPVAQQHVKQKNSLHDHEVKKRVRKKV